MREATMPTTPSWKSGSNTLMAGGGSSPVRGEQRLGQQQRLLAHAALDVAPLAVDAVEHARQFVGAPASSVSRHSMPSVMSASRPAALMRGPSAKPKSKVVATAALRPAALNSAATPAGMRARADARRPCATRRRLLASSFTTSATVPSATSGSSASSLGCVGRVEHAARAQLGAQRQQHVEHHADAGDDLLSKSQPGWLGLTSTSASGSSGPGRWWSVTSTCRPSAPWRRPRRRRWRCRCPR
jgi:hypothetical protein